MRCFSIGFAICIISVNAAPAQTVNQHVQKIGNQVITDVEIVAPPLAVKGQIDGRGASATATLLIARNWRCGGTLFTDDQGRNWRSADGRPVKGQPKELSGWRLIPAEGEQRFFTTDGRLFTRQ